MRNVRAQYLVLLRSLEVPEVQPSKRTKRTPEVDILDQVRSHFCLPQGCSLRQSMADYLAQHVPVETFVSFLGFQLMPFARMLTEVFDFLGQYGRTASSGQAITELVVRKHLRFPVDLGRMPRIWERFTVAQSRGVWDVEKLQGLMPRLIQISSCPGASRAAGPTCPRDLSATCRQQVERLRQDFRTILIADRMPVEQGGHWLSPDLRPMMEQFVQGQKPWDHEQWARDCLGEQLHNGSNYSDLQAKKILIEAHRIIDAGRHQVLARRRAVREFLKLPYWQKRHDLYEVWTLVRLCNDLPHAHIELDHIVDGAWSIPGNGQGKAGEPILRINAPRGMYWVYTGYKVAVPGGRRAMPDWLFCRAPDGAADPADGKPSDQAVNQRAPGVPEFIVECKCGEGYRYRETVRDPMVGKYLPLLPEGRGKALLVNYRKFSRPAHATDDALPQGLQVIEELTPDSNAEPYREAVTAFFGAPGTGTPQPSVPVDVALVVDATASMRPRLTDLRESTVRFLEELEQSGKNTRAAIVFVGDHRADGNAYVTRSFPLSDQWGELRTFALGEPGSDGWSEKEAYEDALRDLAALAWRPGARKRGIMIGDNAPHTADDCPEGVDWEQVVQTLATQEVKMTAVCFSENTDVKKFFERVATSTGGDFVAGAGARAVLQVMREAITG